MTESRHSTSEPAEAAANPSSSDSLEQYYRQGLENVRRRLPDVARELQDAGVVRVLIEYDGCGDSGQIESVEYFDAEGALIEPTGKVSIQERELTGLFYDVIEVRHPGWENNDGAFGDFSWNLLTDTLEHTHHDRFTEFYTTEHEGL